jgi:uncharacterized membrane protein YhdT
VADLILVRRMQPWTKSVVFGCISAAAIAATYTHWPDPDFAGAMFWYNMTFYLPLVLLALVCWIAHFIFTLLSCDNAVPGGYSIEWLL